jgi:hypothetical protein
VRALVFPKIITCGAEKGGGEERTKESLRAWPPRERTAIDPNRAGRRSAGRTEGNEGPTTRVRVQVGASRPASLLGLPAKTELAGSCGHLGLGALFSSRNFLENDTVPLLLLFNN